jgi:hypothetical protein
MTLRSIARWRGLIQKGKTKKLFEQRCYVGQSLKRKEISYSQLGSSKSSNEEHTHNIKFWERKIRDRREAISYIFGGKDEIKIKTWSLEIMTATNSQQIYYGWTERLSASQVTCIHGCSTVWSDFDRASSLICGNKTPTRCSRWFLLQILLIARHVSGTIMPIIRSSTVLYRMLLPMVFGALVFKMSVWCWVEGYVSGLRAAAAAAARNMLSKQ